MTGMVMGGKSMKEIDSDAIQLFEDYLIRVAWDEQQE